MNNITFDDLKLIKTICEELTFSAAAARLEISNGTLSKRLNKIEDQLGSKLIHRPGQPPPTQMGELAYAFAIESLTKFREFHIEAEKIVTGTTDLTIAGNPSILTSDLPDAIHALCTKHPRLRVHCMGSEFQEIMRSVQEKTADIGLITSRPNVDGLRFFPYKFDRLAVLMPIHHPLANHFAIAFADVVTSPLIGMEEDMQISIFLAKHAEKVNLKIQYKIRCNHFDVQANLIARSNHCGIMFESIARRYEKTHAVKSIKLSDDWAAMTFYICTRDRGTLSVAATDFMEMLTAQYAKSLRQ